MDGGGYWTINWAGKPLHDTAAAHLAVLLESSAAMALTSLDISGLFELVSIRMAFEPFVFAVEAVVAGPDATGPPLFPPLYSSGLSSGLSSGVRSNLCSNLTNGVGSNLSSSGLTNGVSGNLSSDLSSGVRSGLLSGHSSLCSRLDPGLKSDRIPPATLRASRHRSRLSGSRPSGGAPCSSRPRRASRLRKEQRRFGGCGPRSLPTPL